MDSKTEFIQNVKQVIRDLKKLCLNNSIPMFVTVYVPDKDEYISDIVSPSVLGLDLKPDIISGHLNVANGFHTVLPPEVLHSSKIDSGTVCQIDFTEIFDDIDPDDDE